MGGTPPRRRDSSPALPDELVEDIFLRLPPDEPASLLRASLISKAWGRAISSPAFRRRLHEFHRTPPMLGFLHNWAWERSSRFIPTTASSLSLAAPDRKAWRALDCRHGRALFLSEGQGAQELLVWEPITGAQRRVPVPSLFESLRASKMETYPGAAVFCTADGCDHRDCHGDPFGLVFVFTDLAMPYPEEEEEEFDIWACVFSSETGTWVKLTSMQSEFMGFIDQSSVLVGRSLLYFLSDDELILEYDSARHIMAMLLPPCSSGYERKFNIMLAEDGGLGVGEYSSPENLKLWTREASVGADAHWVLSRVIDLANLLPIDALPNADSRVQVVGFAEGTNTILLNTVAGIFTVELQSERVRKVCDSPGFCMLIPVVSFYTPVPRGVHHDPPSSGPNEAGGEEGEKKEKVIEQLQQIFDTGSNATEEGDFVDARFSHTLETRVPSHGEVALKCASTDYGCALLYKAQAMNDPLDDVSKSESIEESVMGTTSKDDAGNSKTSGSNLEDATPPQRGESKEGK
ncbi:unnamed protein product [Alopecurus aequalis]